MNFIIIGLIALAVIATAIGVFTFFVADAVQEPIRIDFFVIHFFLFAIVILLLAITLKIIYPN